MEYHQTDPEWLDTHSLLVHEIKKAFQYERNVRAVILFGSRARGSNLPESDIDLIVDLRQEDLMPLRRLRQRLQPKLTSKLDLFLLSDLIAEPNHLLPILDEARLILDRDAVWPRLLERVDKPELAI